MRTSRYFLPPGQLDLCFTTKFTPVSQVATPLAFYAKSDPPNTMFYGVLKIAKNRLILCTPMKMSDGKVPLRFPSVLFRYFVNSVEKIKEMLTKPEKHDLSPENK